MFTAFLIPMRDGKFKEHIPTHNIVGTDIYS